MSETKSASLRVPGANLHWTVRGTGPVLLMIPGGAQGAEASDEIANDLGADYTVVTYDRRGLSRSTLDDPSAAVSITTHSDDAHRLLAAVTDEPAFVFGSSIGALIALDLLAAYPDQVRILVAHEPPASELLPEPERSEVEQMRRDAEETFQRE